MKRKIFIPIILLIVIIAGFTQVKPPVKKVYGYKQASIPGILPDDAEEHDIKAKDAKKTVRKQTYNYWFYLEYPRNEKITITGLWVSNVRFDATIETITQLPVKKIVFTGMDKNDTTVMVPATKNNVLLVYPSGENKVNDSKYALNLARVNELVIRYTWKKSTYYSTIKKLKELNPDVRQ